MGVKKQRLGEPELWKEFDYEEPNEVKFCMFYGLWLLELLAEGYLSRFYSDHEVYGSVHVGFFEGYLPSNNSFLPGTLAYVFELFDSDKKRFGHFVLSCHNYPRHVIVEKN